MVWFHELGHNLYLNHSGRPMECYDSDGSCGYQDLSGAMGECCTVRCFNAPHSYQLGWHNPIALLHRENFPSGDWVDIRIPASIISSDNFVRVRPDWAPYGAANNLFISYRSVSLSGGHLDFIEVEVQLNRDPVPF
jgi:hypothetical protein